MRNFFRNIFLWFKIFIAVRSLRQLFFTFKLYRDIRFIGKMSKKAVKLYFNAL
jgi:hypothetical protein